MDTIEPARQVDPGHETNGEVRELWDSSSSAQEIQTLGGVEVAIANLLQIAASAMSLLAAPELGDTPMESEETAPVEDSTFPGFVGRLTQQEAATTGPARTELFVEQATQYFGTLNQIQLNLRHALYQLRQKKISPSSITAPPTDFVPPLLGVGPSSAPPNGLSPGPDAVEPSRQGLQETRVERDAWLGIVAGLKKMKGARATHSQSVPGADPTG